MPEILFTNVFSISVFESLHMNAPNDETTTQMITLVAYFKSYTKWAIFMLLEYEKASWNVKLGKIMKDKIN